MLAFIIRRLLSTFLVMAIVAVFIFLLLRLSPGDPAAIIVGDNATQVQIDACAGSSASMILWPCNSSLDRGFSAAISASPSSRMSRSTVIRQRIEPTVSLATTTFCWRS